MTRQSTIDQAVRRGFARQYGSRSWPGMIRFANARGKLTPPEHKAVLMAWDRICSSQSYPSPTPKSAGPQPPRFPMSKAEHAGGLS